MKDKSLTLLEILSSRESRVMKQKELIKKYNSNVISFTLNVPGCKKDSVLYRKIHYEGMYEILKSLNENHFKILYQNIRYLNTGPEAYFAVDGDKLMIKKMCVGIEEEHILGRIFDIDVIDSDLNSIGRSNINLPKRKCLICNDEVLKCRRLNKHSLDELLKKIEELWIKYIN